MAVCHSTTSRLSHHIRKQYPSRSSRVMLVSLVAPVDQVLKRRTNPSSSLDRAARFFESPRHLPVLPPIAYGRRLAKKYMASTRYRASIAKDFCFVF
jgi:hypothetical protein